MVMTLQFDSQIFARLSQFGSDCSGSCCLRTSSAEFVSFQGSSGQLTVEIQGQPDPQNPGMLLPIESGSDCESNNGFECVLECMFGATPATLPIDYPQAMDFDIDLYVSPMGMPLNNAGVQGFLWQGPLIDVGEVTAQRGAQVDVPVFGSTNIDGGLYDLTFDVQYDSAVAIVDVDQFGDAECALNPTGPCGSLDSAAVMSGPGSGMETVRVSVSDCDLDIAAPLYFCSFGVQSDATLGVSTLVGELIDLDGPTDADPRSADGSITVQAAPMGPDLIVEQVTAPSTGTQGAEFQITAQVKNIGNVDVGPVTLDLVFSNGPTIGGDAIHSGYVCDLGGVAAGGSGGCGGPIIVPALPSGVYYFGVIADGPGAIAEVDETNNSKSTGPVTIGPP